MLNHILHILHETQKSPLLLKVTRVYVWKRSMETNRGQALSQNIYNYCITKEKKFDIDEF